MFYFILLLLFVLTVCIEFFFRRYVKRRYPEFWVRASREKMGVKAALTRPIILNESARRGELANKNDVNIKRYLKARDWCFYVLLGVFSLSFMAPANSNDSEIEKEVVASFQSLVNSSKNLDAEAYFQHFDSEKFVGLNSDGTNWNSINDLMPLIRSGFDSVDEVLSLDFTNVNVSVIDAYTAVLVNEYSQSMRLKNQSVISVSGGGTQVWSKRSGKSAQYLARRVLRFARSL